MVDYPENKKMFWSTFAEHEIFPDGNERDSYIYCKQGQTMYMCWIMFRHSFIIIYGDTGPFVFQTGGMDALDWAKQAISDPHYTMGKLKSQEMRYDAAATLKNFQGAIRDDNSKVSENMKKVAEALKFTKEDFEDEKEAAEIMRPHGLDYCDYLRYSWDANPDAQWAYWILRTFIDKLEKSKTSN